MAFYAPHFQGTTITIGRGYGSPSGNGPYLVYGSGISDNPSYAWWPIPRESIDPLCHRVRKLLPMEVAMVSGVPRARAGQLFSEALDGMRQQLGDLGDMQQPTAEAAMADAFLTALGVEHDNGGCFQGGLGVGDSVLVPWQTRHSVATNYGTVNIWRWKFRGHVDKYGQAQGML